MNVDLGNDIHITRVRSGFGYDVDSVKHKVGRYYHRRQTDRENPYSGKPRVNFRVTWWHALPNCFDRVSTGLVSE